MIYCFDIDNTICITKGKDYLNAQPIYSRIIKINQLYEEGHTIIFQTARGSVTGVNWKKDTIIQLNTWKVKYHELVMGKINADKFIDDKGINAEEFFK
jgi:hypothetical protein